MPWWSLPACPIPPGNSATPNRRPFGRPDVPCRRTPEPDPARPCREGPEDRKDDRGRSLPGDVMQRQLARQPAAREADRGHTRACPARPVRVEGEPGSPEADGEVEPRGGHRGSFG